MNPAQRGRAPGDFRRQHQNEEKHYRDSVERQHGEADGLDPELADTGSGKETGTHGWCGQAHDEGQRHNDAEVDRLPNIASRA